MKYLISIILIILLTVSTVSYATDIEESIESSIDESDDVVRTVNEFNELRKRLGLSSMNVNDTLKNMAQIHSKYMNYNYVLSSIEESNLEYFRGRYPWDRAAYFNYSGDYVYEFVKKDIVNYKQGLDVLINDPASRYIVLDPMYVDAGMAIEDEYVTFLLGGNKTTTGKFVNYPYSNQNNVVAKWHGDTFEQLYKNFEPEEQVGLPITITYYGKEIDELLDVDVSLVNKDNNEEIPFELLMPGDYYLLKNTLTILPLSPYKYGTNYQVNVDFRMVKSDGDIDNFDAFYSFKTEAGENEVDQSPYITRSEFTEKLVKEFDYSLQEPLEPKFNDVPLSSRKSIYIYTASREGLINGLTENQFGPDLNITKEQAYVIFVRAFENRNSPVIITDNRNLEVYLDNESISTWARTYILKAAELGIIMDVNKLIQPKLYLTEDDFDRMAQLFNKTTSTLKK